MIEIPLSKALVFETRASEFLNAAEYVKLTALGSSVWDFAVTERYAKKALEKSETPFDSFMSNILLGHITFVNSGNDPTKVESGRQYFRNAVASLQPKQGTFPGQFNLGRGYGVWAQHEAFLKNKEDCKQARHYAESAWLKLPDGAELLKDLDAKIEYAENGVRPDMSCFLKVNVRGGCPAPTLTPTLAPALALPGRPTPAPSPVFYPPSPVVAVAPTMAPRRPSIEIGPMILPEGPISVWSGERLKPQGSGTVTTAGIYKAVFIPPPSIGEAMAPLPRPSIVIGPMILPEGPILVLSGEGRQIKIQGSCIITTAGTYKVVFIPGSVAY